MKNIKDIAVIIRGKNESKWLVQCINSINKQINISFDIFYIDNNSDDFSAVIARRMGVFVAEYKEEYLPGRMLNYGIKFAHKRGEFKSFLFLSSHCIINEIDAFHKLFCALDSKKKIRYVYITLYSW